MKKAVIGLIVLLSWTIPLIAPADALRDELIAAIRSDDEATFAELIARDIAVAMKALEPYPEEFHKHPKWDQIVVKALAHDMSKGLGIDDSSEQRQEPPAVSLPPTPKVRQETTFRLNGKTYAHDSLQTSKDLWVAGMTDESANHAVFNFLLNQSIALGRTLVLPAGTSVRLTGRATGIMSEVTIPAHLGKWCIPNQALKEAGVPVPPVDHGYLDEQLSKTPAPEAPTAVLPKEYAKASFFEIHETFIDPNSRLTELQQQEIWKVLNGKWVRWTGRIMEVGVAQGHPYIAVDMGVESAQPDVLLEPEESIHKLTLLVKGRRIFFTARLLNRPSDGKALHLHEAQVHKPTSLTDFYPLEFILPKRALSFATPNDYDDMRRKIGNDPRRIAPVKSAFRQGKAAFIPDGAWIVLTGKSVAKVSEAHLYGDKDRFWLLNRDLRDLGIPVHDVSDN